LYTEAIESDRASRISVVERVRCRVERAAA